MLKVIKSPVSVLVCVFTIFVAKYFFVDLSDKKVNPNNEIVVSQVKSNGSSALAKESIDDIKKEKEELYDYDKMFPSVEVMLKEKSVGSDNAPVILQIFSAYTCGHCGHFFIDVVPELIKNEVKEGKLKIIFEEFPYNAPAVRASLIAVCSDRDNYLEVSKALYKSASEWYSYDKDKFADYMMKFKDITGLDKEKLNACLLYPKLREGLKEKVEIRSNPHQITATPTLVYRKSIRSFKESGAVSYKRVAQIIDKLIKNENPEEEE